MLTFAVVALVLAALAVMTVRAAAEHGIVVLPLSTATFYTRPDISHMPVRDIAPNQVCLAWDSSRRSALIHQCTAIAGTLAGHIASA